VAGVHLSEDPSPTLHTPPPYTHCIRVYCIIIHTGKGGKGGGGDMKQREGEREQQFTKLGENINITDCIFSL
jgi:hypothetical protein